MAQKEAGVDAVGNIIPNCSPHASCIKNPWGYMDSWGGSRQIALQNIRGVFLMKETEGWVKIKKYTDDEGRPVCGGCILWPSFPVLCKFMDMGAVDYGFPGPSCPVWRGESKSEWQPIETAPKDKPLLLLDGEDVGIGFAAEDGDPECASMWMPLPSPPQEK